MQSGVEACGYKQSPSFYVFAGLMWVLHYDSRGNSDGAVQPPMTIIASMV
jgi:hypothetical protein